MLNEYTIQQQEKFDILYSNELYTIDDEITNTLTSIINAITSLEYFITNLFDHKESYDFEIYSHFINIDFDDTKYIIKISTYDTSKCDVFYIFDNKNIKYRHRDIKKEVYWNDDTVEFNTNKEKLNYLKEKIKFLEWIKTYGKILIKLTIQAIDYHESKNPLIKDIKELEKLKKSYPKNNENK